MTDLVDGFMEHHPISPLGSSIKPAQLKAVQQEITNLREQLAKANERIAELEGFYATFEREFKAVAKWAISMQNDICEGKYHNNTPEGMIYSESAWIDCRWKDVTDPLFTSHEEALNKFAIEKKVEVLDALLLEHKEQVTVDLGSLQESDYQEMDVVYAAVVEDLAMQLRKGQSK